MLEFGHVLLTVAAVLVAAAFLIAFGHRGTAAPAEGGLMPKTPASVTKTSEQPEIMFKLEMIEKMRAGIWVSSTTWTIDLTGAEYAALAQSLRKARKAANHGA